MRNLINKEIIEYVKSHDEDNLWRTPLVGFASLEEIYKQKDILDHGHVMPCDVMKDASCVISYFVPFRKEINDSNKCEGGASPLWAEAYEKTNAMFGGLNQHIIEVLKKQACKGIVPEAAFSFDDEKLIAYWSQRHIAYAAGLGTFGINNMLITERGCSGRFNSVVTNLDVETDEPVREERCLYRKKGSYGVCVIRCPGKALTKEEGFDRKACYGECLKNAALYSDIGGSYGRSMGSEVCGKCISLSPCAFK
ncbi:MAG: epoxyqueuosine reductase [Clostridiales bacterium]|nr:epoxyqueuosine reductase [Clostridiales bacterium]